MQSGLLKFSPVRGRETDQSLRKVVQRGHYISVSIESKEQDLVGAEVSALLQDTLKIHFGTRNRSDRRPPTDASEGGEQLVYTPFWPLDIWLILCKHIISAASLSHTGA